jgi:hypothetical protein
MYLQKTFNDPVLMYQNIRQEKRLVTLTVNGPGLSQGNIVVKQGVWVL